MAVNVSGKQFVRQNLPAVLERILSRTGLEGSYLELEVTETTLLSESGDLLDKLARLKTLGIRMALDDFGTGYSSLSYLRQFPIDNLKIDRSFIKDLHVNSEDTAITSAILAMASRFKTTDNGRRC